MTLTALIAMLVIAVIAVPVVALAATLWNEIRTAGLGDVFPDERLLAAINGASEVAASPRGSANVETQLWT